MYIDYILLVIHTCMLSQIIFASITSKCGGEGKKVNDFNIWISIFIFSNFHFTVYRSQNVSSVSRDISLQKINIYFQDSSKSKLKIPELYKLLNFDV